VAEVAGEAMLEELLPQPVGMVDLEWLFCLFQQQVTLEL
jgi:hypothetical protein